MRKCLVFPAIQEASKETHLSLSIFNGKVHGGGMEEGADQETA